jgi:hypothetical protein
MFEKKTGAFYDYALDCIYKLYSGQKFNCLFLIIKPVTGNSPGRVKL